jgi:hypothetical protein
LKRDELSALAIKLPCDEKFASEIFGSFKPTHALLRRKITGRLERQTEIRSRASQPWMAIDGRRRGLSLY